MLQNSNKKKKEKEKAFAGPLSEYFSPVGHTNSILIASSQPCGCTALTLLSHTHRRATKMTWSVAASKTDLFVLLGLLPPPPALQCLSLQTVVHERVQRLPQHQVPIMKPPHAWMRRQKHHTEKPEINK